jgi:prolyl-tRNA synthetase
VQDELFRQADAYRASRTVTDLASYEDFVRYFTRDEAKGGAGFAVAKWCATAASEDKLKNLGVTIRCLPDRQSGSAGRCILTGEPATIDAVFARAY